MKKNIIKSFCIRSSTNLRNYIDQMNLKNFSTRNKGIYKNSINNNSTTIINTINNTIYNNNNNLFLYIPKKKLRVRNAPKNKKKEIKEDNNSNNNNSNRNEEINELSNNFSLDEIEKTKINLESNFYLQILSCLSKSTDDTIIKNNLKTILKKNNITVNDEKLLDMISLSRGNLKENVEDNEELNDMIEGIIQEELSEEEFAKDKEVIFKRPPHSLNELKEVLEQSEKLYEANKQYLILNDDEITSKLKDDFFKKIPNNFILIILSNPDT